MTKQQELTAKIEELNQNNPRLQASQLLNARQCALAEIQESINKGIPPSVSPSMASLVSLLCILSAGRGFDKAVDYLTQDDL